MKSPITGKNMKLVCRNEKINFKEEEFDIVRQFYLCEDSGEEFVDDILSEINHYQIDKRYRDTQQKNPTEM